MALSWGNETETISNRKLIIKISAALRVPWIFSFIDVARRQMWQKQQKQQQQQLHQQ